MITVFFNKEGYYVVGEGLEATLKCSPATDELGKPIFHELHHTYKVLFLALKEVARKERIQGDVIVYNDSRIVDELNGQVQPLDEVCGKWQRTIRRELVPHIRSVVSFRKKAADYLKSQIERGEGLLSTNGASIESLVTRLDNLERDKVRTFKGRVLDKFKRMWIE